MKNKNIPRYRVISIYSGTCGDYNDYNHAYAAYSRINPNEKCFHNGTLIKNGYYAVLIDTHEARQLAANHESLINKS